MRNINLNIRKRRIGVEPSPCMKRLRKFGKWFTRLNNWNKFGKSVDRKRENSSKFKEISSTKNGKEERPINIHMHSMSFTYIQFRNILHLLLPDFCATNTFIAGHVFHTISDIIQGKRPLGWRTLNLLTRPRRKHLDHPHACGVVDNGDQKSVRACL